MLILFNPLPNPIHIFSKSRWSNSAKAVIRTSVSTLSISACGVPEVKIILHTYHTCKNTLVSARVNNNTSDLILKSQYFFLKCCNKVYTGINYPHQRFAWKFIKFCLTFLYHQRKCHLDGAWVFPSLFCRSLVFLLTLSIILHFFIAVLFLF